MYQKTAFGPESSVRLASYHTGRLRWRFLALEIQENNIDFRINLSLKGYVLYLGEDDEAT